MRYVTKMLNCPCGKPVHWREAKKCEDLIRHGDASHQNRQAQIGCGGGKCCSNALFHKFATFAYPYVVLPCKALGTLALVDVDQQAQSQEQQGLDGSLRGKCGSNEV